jgi:hypothetical protein
VAARAAEPALVTVPRYLEAVQSLHGLRIPEIARALRVNASVVRRWRRGTLVPTWRRVRAMTALWGGDAELLALGAALQRYCRATGLSLEEAVKLARSGRRTGPVRRPPPARLDRRQLSLPIDR